MSGSRHFSWCTVGEDDENRYRKRRPVLIRGSVQVEALACSGWHMYNWPDQPTPTIPAVGNLFRVRRVPSLALSIEATLHISNGNLSLSGVLTTLTGAMLLKVVLRARSYGLSAALRSGSRRLLSGILVEQVVTGKLSSHVK